MAGDFDNVVILGPHPDYLDLAGVLNARAFNMPIAEWLALSPDERWAANQRYLDEAVADGCSFRLILPPDLVKPGSYFERELKYLMMLGYRSIDCGSHWELQT